MLMGWSFSSLPNVDETITTMMTLVIRMMVLTTQTVTMTKVIMMTSLGENNCNPCQPLSTSTYQEAKTPLQNSQKCLWRRPTGDYNPSADPINRLARHEKTTIFRLRTGHCGLRSHLKQIGIMDSALCDCKEAEQSVHHILQDCPIWRKQRHQLWLQDESANKLWGTVEDLRRTTKFLATCGLRV